MPGERAKNGHALVVPLASRAVSILQDRPCCDAILSSRTLRDAQAAQGNRCEAWATAAGSGLLEGQESYRGTMRKTNIAALPCRRRLSIQFIACNVIRIPKLMAAQGGACPYEGKSLKQPKTSLKNPQTSAHCLAGIKNDQLNVIPWA